MQTVSSSMHIKGGVEANRMRIQFMQFQIEATLMEIEKVIIRSRLTSVRTIEDLLDDKTLLLVVEIGRNS